MIHYRRERAWRLQSQNARAGHVGGDASHHPAAATAERRRDVDEPTLTGKQTLSEVGHQIVRSKLVKLDR